MLVALACLPLLASDALDRRDAASISAALVFGPITVMLYAASTMLHSVPPGRWQKLFTYLDHSAIFLMIAGTYTPFTLGVLRGRVGWSLLIAVWGLAAYGIVRTLTGPGRPKFLYLAMGWIVLLAAGPLIQRMSLPGLALVVAGGVAYTTGFAFYQARGLPYSHLIWHLFVLLGTACHFLAVRGYAV